MEKEKDSGSSKGARGMREPANLYEAVIALDALKYQQAAEPPRITLTQEQQSKLIEAIRTAVEGSKQQ